MDMRSLLTLPNRLMRPVRKSDEEGQGRQMRILIISDTHRRDENLQQIYRVNEKANAQNANLDVYEDLFVREYRCDKGIASGKIFTINKIG